jgi:hypothetical protein
MAGPSIMVKLLADVSGLGSSFTEAGAKAKTAGATMHDAFRGALDQLNQSGVLGPFGTALASADDQLKQLKGHGREIGPVMMATGAAVAGVGLALTHMGDKDKAAHQQLQASVEATGHSYAQYSGRVDEAIKHQEKFGNASDETQNALQKLTQATNDPAKALDDLGLASDLAAAKHEDLVTASGQLAKTLNGNTKLLKEFGISTKDAAGHTKTQSEIMSELSAKLSGQASAATNTFTGHMKALKVEVTDHINMFGQKYGPAITKAGAAMAGLGTVITTGRAAVNALRESQVVAAAATKIWTAAQAALNLVMDANPIMLVVLAIAAVVAAIVLAYTHCKTFRDIVADMGRAVVAVFDGIKTVALAVFHWIASNWPLLVGILFGPFGLAVAVIATHLGTVRALVGDVINFIRGAFSTVFGIITAPFTAAIGAVSGAIGSIIGIVGRIPAQIMGALSGLGNLLEGIGRDIIGGLGRGIENGAKDVMDKAKSIADSVGNTIKGALKIFSPSHVTQDQGLAIAQGLAVGMTAGYARYVAPALNDTIRGLTAAGGSSTPTTTTPAGRPGPAVVIQNVTVADPMDVDAFMRRVSWEAQRQGV